jgi:hypothetical protein
MSFAGCEIYNFIDPGDLVEVGANEGVVRIIKKAERNGIKSTKIL